MLWAVHAGLADVHEEDLVGALDDDLGAVGPGLLEADFLELEVLVAAAGQKQLDLFAAREHVHPHDLGVAFEEAVDARERQNAPDRRSPGQIPEFGRVLGVEGVDAVAREHEAPEVDGLRPCAQAVRKRVEDQAFVALVEH